MNTLQIQSDARAILSTLLAGGVVLAPTNTGYGLVAMKPEAVRRIYLLKGRPSEKPCVTVGTIPILDDVCTGIDPDTRAWLCAATARWPLALVAPLNSRSTLLRSFDPFVRAQCTKEDTIATFYGVGPVIAGTAQLAFERGELIVGSSANLAGTGNNYTLEDVPESIRAGVDQCFDYGRSPFASAQRLASTILNVTAGIFLRRGVCFDEVERSWELFQAGRSASRSAA